MAVFIERTMANNFKNDRGTKGKMKLSLEKHDLLTYVATQMDHFFPDKYYLKGSDVSSALDLALERLEYCYQHICVKAYNDGKQTYFSHLHGDQYSQFLYYFSNSLWSISENKPLCDKMVQLNRCLSGMFYSYHSGLPDIFLLSHPVGSVLGKAKYGNYFYCAQNCTVASQVGDKQFGEGLFLGEGASILDTNIEIGDWVVVGAGTTVYGRGIKLDSETFIWRDRTGELISGHRSKEKWPKGIFKRM